MIFLLANKGKSCGIRIGHGCSDHVVLVFSSDFLKTYVTSSFPYKQTCHTQHSSGTSVGIQMINQT